MAPSCESLIRKNSLPSSKLGAPLGVLVVSIAGLLASPSISFAAEPPASLAPAKSASPSHDSSASPPRDSPGSSPMNRTRSMQRNPAASPRKKDPSQLVSSPVPYPNKMVAGCAELEKEITRIEAPVPSRPDKKLISVAHIDEALDLLKTREFPQEDGVRLSAIALHESFETVFPHYIPLTELDCPRLRLRLGRAVIETFDYLKVPENSTDATLSPDAEKKIKREIFEAIRDVLTEFKYPTQVEALSDALLLHKAIKSELFRGTADQMKEANALIEELRQNSSDVLINPPENKDLTPEVKAEMTKLGKQSLTEWKRIGEDSWEKVAKLVKKGNEKSQIQFLKSNPEVQKMKPALLKEFEVSAKYLAHARAVVQNFKAD